MIADHYLQLRTELETALSGLLRLASDMHRDSATLDTIHGLATDIREPLLFVVVGEGKSRQVFVAQCAFRAGICQSRCVAGYRPCLRLQTWRGGEFGRGFADADRALPTDQIPAGFQRRRYPRDQHDGR